MIQCITDAQT